MPLTSNFHNRQSHPDYGISVSLFSNLFRAESLMSVPAPLETDINPWKSPSKQEQTVNTQRALEDLFDL